MNSFVELYQAIDESNSTLDKVAALRRFYAGASALDAAWATALLSGRRLRVPVKRSIIRLAALKSCRLSEWLFEECYSAVGDLSETISLTVPCGSRPAASTLSGWIEWMSQLAQMDDARQEHELQAQWETLSAPEVFVLHKIMGGAFRVGVSKELVQRALAEELGLKKSVVAHRLMGEWSPSEGFWDQMRQEHGEVSESQPYPFCLAHPLEGEPETLGDRSAWQAEWKWDGIRAQLICRGGNSYLWSRGEELLEQGFPEIVGIGTSLPPGTILDGEILAWENDRPAPFASLQKRIGRKQVSSKMLAEVPCVLVAFDLLELGGEDLREQPLSARREKLEALVEAADNPALRLSPVLKEETWGDLIAERRNSREKRAEGLMLKKLDSVYEAGRKRGFWWKWKVEPYSIDAVLVYAQRGSGKRASLYTDYTFAVWKEDVLIPFAKAYSGLTDAEIRQVDNFVRSNVVEKFGPVRTVKPQLVFEIAFEGIQASSRHKSGIAVRFPRIARWRKDKGPTDANTLQDLQALLAVHA